MPTAIRVSVIGAGSAQFSLGLVKDLCLTASLAGSQVCFMDALPKKHFPQFYFNDIYRLLYACHLSRLGHPPPPWLVEEAEATASA